jgi:hypothetical protein
LDDLAGSKAEEATYRHTRTAIRSFNFFWQHHNFDKFCEPTLYELKSKYADMVDGFQALCSATHSEQNIMLAHYVKKMIKWVDSVVLPETQGDFNSRLICMVCLAVTSFAAAIFCTCIMFVCHIRLPFCIFLPTSSMPSKSNGCFQILSKCRRSKHFLSLFIISSLVF